jgi:hypothetical protein
MIAVWMMMVVCTGLACQVVELPMDGPYACAMMGQFRAAAWIAEHAPGATLRRWRCYYGEPA